MAGVPPHGAANAALDVREDRAAAGQLSRGAPEEPGPDGRSELDLDVDDRVTGRAGGVAGLVLAAGRSSRLGRPKQLVEFQGRPLLEHAVRAALGAGLDPVIVVLGHAAASIRERVPLPHQVLVVVNERYREGQSTSLVAGLRAIADLAPPRHGAAVASVAVLLVDQPTLGVDTIRRVIAEHRSGGSRPVTRPRFRGAPGHPVVVDREVWPLLLSSHGDRGARDILTARPDLVRDLELDLEPPVDVDTDTDLGELPGQP